jgi:hypothetical protein
MLCPADSAFTVATVSVTGGGSVYFYGDTMVASPDAVCLLGQESRQANVTPTLASCSAPPNAPGFARLRLAFNGLDADEDAYVDVLYRGVSSCTAASVALFSPAHTRFVS